MTRRPNAITKQTTYVYNPPYVVVAGMCVCVCVKTHTQVSVPDLDRAILAAGCDELPIPAVGAARGDDLLPLHGARFEHRLVLLL